MTTHNILLVILLFTCTRALGQYTAHYERSALASFYSKDYKTALLYSEKVLELDSLNVASLFVAGESARMIQDFKKAESYLELIPDKAKAGFYTVTDFRLAAVKEELGKKEEAVKYYLQYLNTHDAENDLLSLLAREALEMLKKGGVAERRKGDYLTISRLPENINSELLEVAPLRYADKLYFTSVFRENAKAKPVRRIYESLFNGQPRLVAANPQNEKLNASYLTLLPDGSKMYYTLCADQDYHQTEDCQLWYRERTYEGDWGVPKKLPPHINLKGYTATQPSVGWDKSLKKYVLFFTSNRPGGKGKMDIWYSTIEQDGSFGEPVPLAINTLEDDVAPYFHQVSQTLFFSSTGWPGLGGFDIYRTAKSPEGAWERPENLGELVNSFYDDLHYTYHSGSRNAYFVSNRPGSRCKEKQNPQDCLDIYEARIFVELKLITLDAKNKAPVFEPQAELLELSKNSEAGSFASKKKDNTLYLKLETGKTYRLKVIVEGFEPKYIDIDTQHISYFTSLEKIVYLEGMIDP